MLPLQTWSIPVNIGAIVDNENTKKECSSRDLTSRCQTMGEQNWQTNPKESLIELIQDELWKKAALHQSETEPNYNKTW
jgi:hypothetical protein